LLKTANGGLHVHRLLLRLASPVFSALLEATPKDGRREHVTVSEDAETVIALLAMLYPNMKRPQFANLDSLAAVLTAAEKYRMSTILETLRVELINPRIVDGKLQPSFISTKPLRVYAIAHSLGQEFAQITVMAAEETLRFDLHATESSEDIDSMATSLYRQLVTLRKTRRRWLQHQNWGFPAKAGLIAYHASNMRPSTPISLANAIEQTLTSPVRRPINPFGQSASAVNLPQHPFEEQSSVLFPQTTLQQQPQQPPRHSFHPLLVRRWSKSGVDPGQRIQSPPPIQVHVPAFPQQQQQQLPEGCPYCGNWQTVVANAKSYILKRPALSTLKSYYTPNLHINCTTCSEGLQRLLLDMAQKYTAMFPQPTRVE